MVYTLSFKDETSTIAKSIINLLQSLSVEYDFVELQQTKDEDDDIIGKELEYRRQHLLKHGENYKEWDAVKDELLDIGFVNKKEILISYL